MNDSLLQTVQLSWVPAVTGLLLGAAALILLVFLLGMSMIFIRTLFREERRNADAD